MKSDKITPICPINRWKAVLLVFLLNFTLFFTSGCWNKVEVVDTVETEGIVFDLEGGLPSLSIQLAKPGSSESGTQPNKPTNITQTGLTYTECARKVMLSLPRLPLWSHSRVIVIGEELANADLAQMADFVARNRNIRKTAVVFVSKGISGQECLEAELPLESYSIDGLNKLIRLQEHQIGFYMPINMDDFLESLATPGIQPAVPEIGVLEIEGKKILRLDGTAVFKDRKQVGSLTEAESQGYRFLNPKMITGGFLTIHAPGDNSPDSNKLVAMEITRSKAIISPEFEGNRVKKITIRIEAEGNFYEQNFAGEIISLENISEMERLTNEEIKRQVAAAIAKAQGLNSDIFGWGRMVQHENPALWHRIDTDWPIIFSGIETDITVDFTLRRTYLLDRSFVFKE